MMLAIAASLLLLGACGPVRGRITDDIDTADIVMTDYDGTLHDQHQQRRDELDLGRTEKSLFTDGSSRKAAEEEPPQEEPEEEKKEEKQPEEKKQEEPKTPQQPQTQQVQTTTTTVTQSGSRSSGSG